MKKGPKAFSKVNILLKGRFTRTIFFLSIAIAVAFPVVDRLFVYPLFTSMLVDNTIIEVKRLATHMSIMTGIAEIELKQSTFPEEMLHKFELLEKEFSLVKLKIFSISGEVLYSTNPKEIGTINTKPYFYNIVARGKPYAQILRKDSKSAEGQTVTADVVETYVPIMRSGKFNGAFEIYYDITVRQRALDKLLKYSSAVLFLVGFGLLATIIIVSLKAATAEEALHKAHDELEIRVAERTAELKVANEQLQNEVIERKQAEVALRESEEKFRNISASAQDAIILTDHQGNVSYWNEAAEKIFGYSQEEIRAEPLHYLIIPERFRERHSLGLEKFRKTGQGTTVGNTFELIARRKGGKEFPIEISLSSVSFKGKWHALAIVRNITERKQMEQKLLQAEKLASLGVLSSGAAHEINNPLNVIALHLQILLKDESLGPECYGACKEIMDQTENVREVLSGLDNYAQQMKAEKQEIDIREELDQVIERFWQEVAHRGVAVVRDLVPDSPMVMGNSVLLQRVFENILDNAIKAMLHGGTLTVQTKVLTQDDAPWFKIRITDTGVGISKEHLTKIFDPFFTLREVGEGKGLGLSIALGIVENHGGTITVESTEGYGTTFEILLPATFEGKDRIALETF